MSMPYADPGVIVPYTGDGAVTEMPMPEGAPPAEEAVPETQPATNGVEGDLK